MIVYRYRTIENALKEIETGTFHFASREELNDPIEGYVSVHWQGDKSAWEGLLRNYICSVYNAVEMFFLQCHEGRIFKESLIIDIESYNKVPLGGVLKILGETFLHDPAIQSIASFYGDNLVRVNEKELHYILHLIHFKALSLCFQIDEKNGLFSKDLAEELLKTYPPSGEIFFPFSLMETDRVDEKDREMIIDSAISTMNSFFELLLIHQSIDTSDGNRDNLTSIAQQKRNWMRLNLDYPKAYILQLKEMLYPRSYIVCFSGKNDNSAMWGNYANNHQGVCFIYETDQDNSLKLVDRKKGNLKLEVKPVIYHGELIERNFYETIGRVTMQQVRSWLTGTDGISSSIEVFSNTDEWRRSYWKTYQMKTYRKNKAWEYENEYRIVITDSLHEFSTRDSQNLRYDTAALKGVIFGINTSDYDKKRIIEKIKHSSNLYQNVSYSQAEYNEKTQTIIVRKALSQR